MMFYSTDSEGRIWDLESVRHWRSNTVDGAMLNRDWKNNEERRPADTADLVDALIREGGEVYSTDDAGMSVWLTRPFAPGKYLVFKLEDE